MRLDEEDYGTGWTGLALAIRTDEVRQLIKLLEWLEEHPNQHFHLRNDLDGDGGIADIEIYLQQEDQRDNMMLVGPAIEPNS